MGAKDSTKLNLRRPTTKCGVCSKKFLGPQALARHLSFSHKVKAKNKVQQRGKPNTLLGKAVKPLKERKGAKSGTVPGVDPSPVMDFRKVAYECPQCHGTFAVNFSAIRHIQKFHCINSSGMKVPPNSDDLIKPIPIEVCLKCNERLYSSNPHTCVEMPWMLDPYSMYVCTGCNQKFDSLKLFDMHVTGLHCDDYETLFFPNKNEFNSWKEDLESQTKVRFLILNRTDSMKLIYHCTFLSASDNNEDNAVHLCPASFFLRDFHKSIQVHFYKQHFGHTCKYELPAKFNKYKIMQLLKEPKPITEPFELKSLHMDFKTLMDFLIIESDKCDKSTLDVLHKKAQEMLTIVNNWCDVSKMNKRKMTDEEITSTLETLDAKRKKDDSTEVPKPIEEDIKPTIEDIKPLIEDTKPIKVEVDIDESDGQTSVNLNERKHRNKAIAKDGSTPPLKIVPSSPCSSKSSFNDSYKEFVDKTFKEVDKPKFGKTYNKTAKTNQHQPKLSPPAQKTELKPNIIKNKKKNIVKTKIGQFKPSLSPRKSENNMSLLIKDRRSSIATIDLDYEVREQENDCNILVLKI